MSFLMCFIRYTCHSLLSLLRIRLFRKASSAIFLALALSTSLYPAIAWSFQMHTFKLKDLALKNSQITGGNWNSGTLNIPLNDLLAISPGDLVIFDLMFSDDKKLKITDTFFNESEKIFFFIKAEGGIGGGPLHDTQYEWAFIDPWFDLTRNNILGSKGIMSGNTGNTGIAFPIGFATRSINLTDSMFAFRGIRLRVFVPETVDTNGKWLLSTIQFDVGGDKAEIITTHVPEPTTITLLFLGLLGLGFSRRKRLTSLLRMGEGGQEQPTRLRPRR